MSKYFASSITLILLIALPSLASLYATQMIAAQAVHNGRPMIPVPPGLPGAPGPKVQTALHTSCPLPSSECGASINWAGYAVWSSTFSTAADAGTVTDVKGSWTVPSLTGINSAVGSVCKNPDVTWYDASFWVGIDGFATQTVEQTGTSVDCYYGVAQYTAWYEFFPATPILTVFSVSPGDHMTAEVSYSKSTHKFTLTITDVPSIGVPVTYTTPPTAVSGAAENSAEWIAENAAACITPSCSVFEFLSLSDFGSTTFSSATATVKRVTGSISSFGTYQQWIADVNLNFPATPYLKDLPTPITKTGAFTFDFVSAGP